MPYPATYIRVPGEPLGATFKTVLFKRANGSFFRVSNRYLSLDQATDTYYMDRKVPVNGGYRKTPRFI